MGEIVGLWIVCEQRCGDGFLELHILAWLDFLEEEESRRMNLWADEACGVYRA
jgi:hypothetical protein